MSQPPTVIRQSELLNQVVLDRASMQEMGQIEVLWTYPKAHRVFGFICKSGWLGSKKTAFNLDQLDAIGSDGAIVNSPPVETDAEKVRQLESLVDYEVWTDNGDRVGKIIDYTFDFQTGEIQHYLYASSGWGGIVGSIYMLPPNYILRLGKERAMVPAESVESFAIYRAGIQAQFSKVKDLLQEEKTQVKEEVRSLMQQAREKARSLKEKAKTVAEQLIDDFELEEPTPVSSSASEPAPWDDWEIEEKTTKPDSPKSPAPKSERDSAGSSGSDRTSDAWDDDDAWV